MKEFATSLIISKLTDRYVDKDGMDLFDAIDKARGECEHALALNAVKIKERKYEVCLNQKIQELRMLKMKYLKHPNPKLKREIRRLVVSMDI